MNDHLDMNGLQRKILRERVLEDFDRDEFEILLSEGLNTTLSRITGASGFEKQVFDVIQWSRKRRKLAKLIEVIIEARPHIGRMIDFAAPAAPPGTAGARPGERPEPSTLSQLEGLVRNGEGIDRYGPMLDRFVSLQSQVCRVEAGITGTGFLVAPDLVLTNYHVVEHESRDKGRAEDIVCRFDYLSESARGVAVRLAKTEWCIASAPYAPGDERIGGRPPTAGELDYALLRLAKPVGDDQVKATGRARGSVAVSASRKVPHAQSILFIAQHPDTAPLSSSWGLSLGPASENLRMRYTAETLGGSSGSPVFDGDLSLVALHHAGQPGAKLHPGDYNQGIPVALIVADLESKKVESFWE